MTQRDYTALITPLTRAAFFAEAGVVARAELALVPGVELGDSVTHGGMQMVHLRAPEDALPRLARCACVQGLFATGPQGWQVVGQGAGFALHEDFVWGEKYRGKTSELLTQLLLNLGLAQIAGPGPLRLLDPMCGRGTTLLWALRYGISATGIEQDPQALPEVRRGLKKWTKLHRQKHKLSEGWVQKANKRGQGKYLEFAAEGHAMRIVTGDSRKAEGLLGRKPFDLIVTDLPYGVQHMGGDGGARSPLAVVADAAPGWAGLLAPGGAMVIAYNANIPKRADLLAAFDGLGLVEVPLDVAHRMSESILRDVLVMTRPL